jgi:glycosyltransferase involved in cell wall biosynthesis
MSQFEKSTKVSVIVPMYNSSETIDSSLKSLCSQTLDDLEIIVVDDCSLDNSIEIVKKIASADSRIKIIALSKNSGAHEARSAGIKCSSGSWIGFMDADDYVCANMFQELWQAGEDDNADIVICGADRVKPSREFITPKVRFKKEEVICKDIFKRFCQVDFGTGSLWNKLYRRDLIFKHGTISFKWRQDANEDVLVNIGCFMDAKLVKTICLSLYEYVMHGKSITQNTESSLAYTQLLCAYALAIDCYKNCDEQILFWIDHLYRKQMAYSCYYIHSPLDLLPFKDDLHKSMVIIANERPASLAAMANRGLWSPKTIPDTFSAKWKIWVKASKELIRDFIPMIKRHVLCRS